MMSAPRLRRTLPAMIAAALACCYAGVLVVLAVVLVVDWTTGRGTIGHLGSTSANRGVSFFVVLCIGGAVVLVSGAATVWRGRRGLLAIIPLAIVVAIGCVGEPIDIVSGESVGSNIIGAFVIAAAVVPIVLLLLPRGSGRPMPAPVDTGVS
jgi:hypothetical protein